MQKNEPKYVLQEDQEGHEELPLKYQVFNIVIQRNSVW
jgi:hypothetical protein